MITIRKLPQYRDLVALNILKIAVRAVLKHQSQPSSSDLTIVLSDDEQVRDLNRQYLEIDAPTDVLSFSSGEPNPETGRLYLGDIIISIPRAQSQAESAGHSLSSELQLLTVHGVLHLLGFDHAEPAEKAIMWAIQKEILDLIGCKITKLPDD